MAAAGITLVYGGSSCGLMGVLAQAHLQAGGKVQGVYLKNFEHRQPPHTNLRIYDVDSLYARKMMMMALADAFIILPGGIGTLEELMEVWTLAKIGFHQKKCAIFNYLGFYEPLQQLSKTMLHHGFLTAHEEGHLLWVDTIEQLIDKLLVNS